MTTTQKIRIEYGPTSTNYPDGVPVALYIDGERYRVACVGYSRIDAAGDPMGVEQVIYAPTGRGATYEYRPSRESISVLSWDVRDVPAWEVT